MKKTNPRDNTFLKNPKKEIEVKYSPDFRSSQDAFNSDYKLALFLSYLKSFRTHILKIRHKLGIIQPLKYPQKPTVKNVVRLIFTLDEGKRKLLKNKVKRLAKKYRLSDDWLFSIQITVLSHTLLVPQVESIKYLRPESVHEKSPDNSMYETPEEKELAEDYGLDNLFREEKYKRLKSYPVIYLTRQVKKGELLNWIKDNFPLLKVTQRNLPKKRTIKRDLRNIFWGHIAWFLKQEGVHKWNIMSIALEKFLDKLHENAKNYPGQIELRKSYYRFLKSLKETESS